METMIEVRQLCKSFVVNKKQNHVLRNVDLTIQKGEFIAVMGPSGSGKSTLLYTISGMDHINSGTVEFDHKEISRYNEMEMAKLRLHEMGFIFQQMHFLNNLNIYDNVILPGYMAKKRKHKEINAYAEELLQKFQITSIAGHSIQEVSGGELQRACIARAMINQPQILFADEPTGALNRRNSDEVLSILQQLHEAGQSIAMVTHDLRAAAYGTRILYMEDGRILDELDLSACNRKEREAKVSEWLTLRMW